MISGLNHKCPAVDVQGDIPLAKKKFLWSNQVPVLQSEENMDVDTDPKH
jgi:hypothetical protein